MVGTHALVQEGVAFADLSLAVIDEQHRFGLHQRMALKGKGGEPDVLIMTATPIPRTLALTYYGDLDVIVLDEMPEGPPADRDAGRRAPAETSASGLRPGARSEVGCRPAGVRRLRGDRRGRTAPQVKAAEAEAERLATEVFPELRVELLHGRMRPRDKEAVMERFRDGDADVLIATTVIEVGVDVPNATVMLVENAERFGLAQLHQLRGRIGRGAHASLLRPVRRADEENDGGAGHAIDAMVRTTDGFELADEDLRLRGEGTLFDTKQSGMPDLKLARLADDLELVRRARVRAFALIEDDPRLERAPVAARRAPVAVRGLDRLALPLLSAPERASAEPPAAGRRRLWACGSSPGAAKGMRLGPVPAGVRPSRTEPARGSSRASPCEVPEARVLDLYAGTGATGDRGAVARRRARRLRRSAPYQASAAIHDNLDRTRLADRATVVTQGRERVRAPSAPQTDGPVRSGPARPALRRRQRPSWRRPRRAVAARCSPTRDGRWS